MTVFIGGPGAAGHTSYDGLVSAESNWLDRDDLAPQIPDFIVLMEARLNRLLRSLNQETKAVWSIAAETFDLPDDFRQMRVFHVEGVPNRPLEMASPVNVAGNYPPGISRAYWIEGRTLTLAPAPNTPTNFAATYYVRIPPLNGAGQTNWLLEEHPDIYLWGTLHQAATYIRDADAMTETKSYLDDAIAELQRESRLDRWGGGPLTPRSPVQTRGARC